MATIIMDTAIGHLQLIATEKGMAAVRRIGKDEFSKAERHKENLILESARQQLEEYFAGYRYSFSLPLDISDGTAFRRQVWGAARRVPYGETISYGELAASIGRPRAARAVGSALGRNPLLILVPCHRVLRSDGSLGGFGAGLENKRFLLDLEKSANKG